MTPSTITTANNFLTKAEQQSGSIAKWLIVAGGIFGLYAAGDIILGLLNFGIEAVGKLIVLGGLGLVAFMFFMWLSNPATHVMLRHLNYAFARKVSTIMMKADPFGRMRAFANEYLQGQWEKFNAAATDIQAQLIETRSKLEKALAERETKLKEAEALESRYCSGGQWASIEHHNAFRSASTKVQFLDDAIAKREKRLVRLELFIKVLDRMRETFRYQIEMTRMTADHLEEQFKEARSMDNATSAAAVAFSQGDMATADKEVRDYIEQLTAEHIARAEMVMKEIPQLTAAGDIMGDVAEDEMLARLRNLDSETTQALRGVESQSRAIAAGTPADTVQLLQAVPVARKYLR